MACQVLHATTDMKRTLGHVRKLLKPGGKLILVETTNDQLDLFFTFGLLPGWWLSKEEERQSTPSLTPDLWQTMLTASGFSGLELEVRDCDDPEFYMINTIMSTAKGKEPVAREMCDITDANHLAAMQLRREEQNMPPVRGIVHCAMVLQDALFASMTAQDFNATLRPKVQGG
ncbi:KR-domain-containing protein [Colletotrichum eremochloae]|nr:KR-domain-containing protein [Colletotrichum eremochloae]